MFSFKVRRKKLKSYTFSIAILSMLSRRLSTFFWSSYELYYLEVGHQVMSYQFTLKTVCLNRLKQKRKCERVLAMNMFNHAD